MFSGPRTRSRFGSGIADEVCAGTLHVDELHEVVAPVVTSHGDGQVVGGDEPTVDPTITLGVRAGLDLDQISDGSDEVHRGPQVPFESGARDLERVGVGDEVCLVEGCGHAAGRRSEVCQVDAALAVHQDTQAGTGVLEVVQVQAEIGQDRHDDIADPFGRDAHRVPPVSVPSAWIRRADGLVASGSEGAHRRRIGGGPPGARRSSTIEKTWATPTPTGEPEQPHYRRSSRATGVGTRRLT